MHQPSAFYIRIQPVSNDRQISKLYPFLRTFFSVLVSVPLNDAPMALLADTEGPRISARRQRDGGDPEATPRAPPIPRRSKGFWWCGMQRPSKPPASSRCPSAAQRCPYHRVAFAQVKAFMRCVWNRRSRHCFKTKPQTFLSTNAIFPDRAIKYVGDRRLLNKMATLSRRQRGGGGPPSSLEVSQQP